MEDKCETCEGQGFLICGNCDAYEKLEDEKATLQAQVDGMREVLDTMKHSIADDLHSNPWPRSRKYELIADAEKALLSPTPAGEWVSVRRDVLAKTIFFLKQLGNPCDGCTEMAIKHLALIYPDLKAALGTGGEEN